MRTKLKEELSRAMKSRDTVRVSTLRLINAAIKDKDISLRGDDNSEGVSDKEILSILSKMIKQRAESIRQYEEAGRIELAEGERAEVKVIEEFLPEKLTSDQIDKAITEVITSLEASSIRDMGKVMSKLKELHDGQVDFNTVSVKVKKALTGL